MENRLVHLNRARQELALAKSIDEVKDIRDKAEALRAYAKQAGYGLEMQNECAEIKLRAERRAGEMLGENPDIHPGGDRRPLSHDVIKLSELGISLMQSHRWQIIALFIPDSHFEQYIAETKHRRWELTSVGAYRLAKQLKREGMRQELAQLGETRVPPEGIQIETGDFRELGKGIPLDSIDLIFTDPSYGKDYLNLWGPLAELAARVLKPGRFLLAYCGKLYLPFILGELGEHLEYYWVAGKYYDQGHSFFRSKRIWDQWRPILIYQKPGPTEHEWFLDMIRMGSREEAKEFHDYGQSMEDAKYYTQKLTSPGEVVLDVCCGSGTILLAAKLSNRRAIGFDVDESLTQIAKARLAENKDETAKVS